MHSVNINESVFDKITRDKPIKVGFIQKWLNYISLSRESEEASKLGNMTLGLIIIIIMTISYGVMEMSIDLTINGIQGFMHLFSFIFSLYALMKAKKNANMHFTYGYTRYETIAAFSNCVFLIISSLFLVLASLHHLGEHDESGHDTKDNNSANDNTNNNSDHGHKDAQSEKVQQALIFVFYVKIFFNIIGIYSFSEYAFFSPVEKFDDIGANTQKYAYSGVNESTYKNYSYKYDKFYRYLSNNSSSFVEEAGPKQLNAHPHSPKLHFTSHYENMHSVFLHFFIDFLFNFSTLAGIYLIDLKYNQTAFILPVIIMIITILLTKKLFVFTFKILLQALPVDDEKGVQQMLGELQKINGVIDIPQQYFWGLTVGYLVCNVTIRIRKSANYDDIYNAAHNILSQKFYSICLQIQESKTEY